MSSFAVISSSQKKTLPDKGYGPKQIITLVLDPQEGSFPSDTVTAEWFTNADTPLPEAGTKIEGSTAPAKYGDGLDFKKASSFGGGGGGYKAGGMSPDREKAIVHQHSQDMSLRALDLAFTLGVVDPKPTSTKDLLEMIGKLADWFDKDVDRAKAA